MALTMHHISKSFGSKKAVDNLSLEVKESSVFGLLGTNGAGKTTTIRMILGIMDRDEGEILWNGAPISRQSVRVGYMPEERGIYPKVTVAEQLEYFGKLRGMSRPDARQSARQWMERLNVTEYSRMLAEKLSKGNQQKIQLIAALIHHPELIILDEPFSGLDPINTDVFKGVIGELIAQGCTLIMSSHQMATVEQYCRDLVILHSGQTVLQGNLREIKAGYGHTRLSVGCGPDTLLQIQALAQSHEIDLLEQTADGGLFQIHGDESAHALLRDMITQNLYPERFDIREPSLHDIFVEKAGGLQ